MIGPLAETTYRSAPGVNWSTAKYALTSGKAYAHAVANPVKPTPAMRFGTAVHAAVLEPDTYAPTVVPAEYVTGSGALSDSKKAREWIDQHPGELLLTDTEIVNATIVVVNIAAHPAAAALLAECPNREHAAFWTDAATGLECKAKCDAYGTDTLIDLKTYGGPWDVQAIIRECVSRRYFGQLCYYAAGLAANGVHVAKLGLIVVQNSAPYDVAVLVLDDSCTQHGDREVRDALSVIANAQVFGYEGAFAGVITATLPKWASREV